jgi:hypothetical protein
MKTSKNPPVGGKGKAPAKPTIYADYCLFETDGDTFVNVTEWHYTGRITTRPGEPVKFAHGVFTAIRGVPLVSESLKGSAKPVGRSRSKSKSKTQAPRVKRGEK